MIYYTFTCDDGMVFCTINGITVLYDNQMLFEQSEQYKYINSINNALLDRVAKLKSKVINGN